MFFGFSNSYPCDDFQNYYNNNDVNFNDEYQVAMHSITAYKRERLNAVSASKKYDINSYMSKARRITLQGVGTQVIGVVNSMIVVSPCDEYCEEVEIFFDDSVDICDQVHERFGTQQSAVGFEEVSVFDDSCQCRFANVDSVDVSVLDSVGNMACVTDCEDFWISECEVLNCEGCSKDLIKIDTQVTGVVRDHMTVSSILSDSFVGGHVCCNHLSIVRLSIKNALDECGMNRLLDARVKKLRYRLRYVKTGVGGSRTYAVLEFYYYDNYGKKLGARYFEFLRTKKRIKRKRFVYNGGIDSYQNINDLSINNLVPELLVEVLLRLPVPVFPIVLCVCKHWREVVSNCSIVKTTLSLRSGKYWKCVMRPSGKNLRMFDENIFPDLVRFEEGKVCNATAIRLLHKSTIVREKLVISTSNGRYCVTDVGCCRYGDDQSGKVYLEEFIFRGKQTLVFIPYKYRLYMPTRDTSVLAFTKNGIQSVNRGTVFLGTFIEGRDLLKTDIPKTLPRRVADKIDLSKYIAFEEGILDKSSLILCSVWWCKLPNEQYYEGIAE